MPYAERRASWCGARWTSWTIMDKNREVLEKPMERAGREGKIPWVRPRRWPSSGLAGPERRDSFQNPGAHPLSSLRLWSSRCTNPSCDLPSISARSSQLLPIRRARQPRHRSSSTVYRSIDAACREPPRKQIKPVATLCCTHQAATVGRIDDEVRTNGGLCRRKTCRSRIRCRIRTFVEGVARLASKREIQQHRAGRRIRARSGSAGTNL